MCHDSSNNLKIFVPRSATDVRSSPLLYQHVESDSCDEELSSGPLWNFLHSLQSQIEPGIIMPRDRVIGWRVGRQVAKVNIGGEVAIISCPYL